MHAFFTLCGVAAVGVGVRGLRPPPRRGEPDFRQRRFDQYFHSILVMLIGSIFVVSGIAALFFDWDLGVPSEGEFVQSVLWSLVLLVIVGAWRRFRRRRRS